MIKTLSAFVLNHNLALEGALAALMCVACLAMGFLAREVLVDMQANSVLSDWGQFSFRA